MNKKTALAIGFLFSSLLAGTLHAQSWLGSPWQQSSPAVTTGTDSNGTFVSTAPPAPTPSALGFNATASSTTNPQMLWVPGLSAFRVGQFYIAPSSSEMGLYSFASGQNSRATGMYGVAMGYSSYAGADGAVALGWNANATAWCSFAAAGNAFAEGSYSIAMGSEAWAEGDGAIAIGSGSWSTYNGVAIGNNYAFAIGAAAMGHFSTATSYASFVIGSHNVGKSATNGTPSATTWVANDPLFEIGNGTYSTPSNALTVYKNGDIKIKPQGDISMGEFAP